MRKHARLLTVGAVVPALGLWLLAAGNGVAAGPGAAAVPPEAYTEIVQEALKNIQTGMAAPTAKTSPALVRTNAILIAAAAQNQLAAGGGNPAGLATTRDAALSLAEASTGKAIKVAAAKKEAEALAKFPAVTPNPAAKPAPVDFSTKFELDDVMTVFEKKSKGGQDIDAELLSLGTKKGAIPPAMMGHKLELDCYKTAIIATLVPSYVGVAAKKGGAAAWNTWAEDMEKHALELAQAAKANNAVTVKATINKLGATCTQCHEKYR